MGLFWPPATIALALLIAALATQVWRRWAGKLRGSDLLPVRS